MSDSPTSPPGRIAWDELPELLDRPALRDRLGLKRTDIDRIFDRLDVYRIPGSQKAYVHRDAVREQLHVTPPAPGRRVIGPS